MNILKRLFRCCCPAAADHRTRPVARPSPVRRRTRLDVECLEERTLLNNRFVVPVVQADNVSKFADVHAALIAPGLQAGDVIQIEPNSATSGIEGFEFPAVKNLTIQGDPAFDVQSIPIFFLQNMTIDAGQEGITLKNVQLGTDNSALSFQANGTITGARIYNSYAGPSIELIGTSAAVISNSYIENDNAANFGSLISVSGAAGSHNIITDNQFISLSGQDFTLLLYGGGGAGSADVVAHNTFVGQANFGSGLVVIQDTQGLTFQGNTLSDSDVSGTALGIGQSNVNILDNVISLPNGGLGSTGIADYVSNAGDTSSVVIANNKIDTGGKGFAINFSTGLAGSTLNAKVQGNDYHGNAIGIAIYSTSGASVTGIDLGGGSQGSLGANNFHGFEPNNGTAIADYAPLSAGPVQATGNLFSVADPSTVIVDHKNSPTLSAVVATNPLAGNAAYVQTLFLDFLHRAGDVTSLADAGGWVNQLNLGAPAAVVANAIGRSQEALGIQVNALYHRFLRRQADAGEVAGWLSHLQNGATLEWVTQQIAGSAEYQSLHHADDYFVTSLYDKLLNRIPSQAEVAGWLAILPALGRAGVAQGFVSSAEYRADQAQEDYADLLHRFTKPAAAEVNGWVNSGLDDLTMDVAFASSAEFQVTG